ncbi:hypothetical protein [Kribbella deserti]|uniref:Uncharacterized protein n=1 Tax=Kribbella deserti TaxID=1926257 RepID=A0ABV6QEV3_9ACTN
MWPALSLDQILKRARLAADPADPLGERLISMVFAPPGHPVWTELRCTVAYLNAQSGAAWDLFFVGMPAIERPDLVQTWLRREWPKHFRPEKFNEVARQVQLEHRRALEVAGQSRSDRWRHTGGADLVSIMAYDGAPDWLSLTHVRLDQPGSQSMTLAEVTARLAIWRDEPADPELSPGRLREVDSSRAALVAGLAATAAALSADLAANAAYDILKNIF